MAVHYFLVAVDDKGIKDARFKAREGAELAGWRLLNDLSSHFGPEAERYSHIRGVYHAHYVLFQDSHYRRGQEVTDA